MNSFTVRQKFLAYFERNKHAIVPSSSLIPAEDPTLLFANAGMNQFKDLFLGKEKRSYTRATSSQKCVRAGGKHNDLDAVGFTARHLTFFEMLGNFSFGDYFKKEAITFAWEFLIKEVGLPAEKLHVSVFRDDQEAYDLWHTMIGIPTNRIVKLGEKDNFWSMGDTGPCGPCTEIYVDLGADKGCKQPSCAPGCDCPRFIEIWNLVFMQFDRQSTGSMQPLAATGVDTGMGLERLCMVIQGKENVYGTDLFTYLIERIESLTGITYTTADTNTKAAFNVLSDHVRSSALLIADGCTPSNEGRGYVLRKIIRRAALFAQKLSSDLTLFPKLANTFIDSMGTVYKELVTSRQLIENLLYSEIEKFNTNLLQGKTIFDRYLHDLKKSGKKELSGEQIFKLYDTYGFPPEITRVLALEQGLTLDMDGFEAEMKKQQEQSGQKTKGAEPDIVIGDDQTTTFVGYEKTTAISSVSFVQYVNDHAWIVTEQSPFYVESGGQVSDQGLVIINGTTYPVLDLKKAGNRNNPAILVKLDVAKATPAPAKKIVSGDKAECIVASAVRANTVKNHTATHMLQAALMSVLGPQIKQAGSLVCADYFRYDFNHHEGLTSQQIEEVEAIVNKRIMDDIPLEIFNTTLDDAKTKGVISFFGEKYNPENVRVVKIPGFSAELCGGTHASSTGIIGCFKITSETALSSGTRRITGVTGPQALALFQLCFGIVKKLGEDFKVKPEGVLDAVHKLQQQHQETLATIKQLKKQNLKTHIPAWAGQISSVDSVPFLYLELEDLGGDDLKTIAQELEKTKPGFYFLVSKDDSGRVSYLGYAAKGFEQKIDLKKLALWLKETCEWRGGGNASLIQGGGATMPAGLKEKIQANCCYAE